MVTPGYNSHLKMCNWDSQMRTYYISICDPMLPHSIYFLVPSTTCKFQNLLFFTADLNYIVYI